MKEHEVFCRGKPTMFKHSFNEDTGILLITCMNCRRVMYKCEFKVGGLEKDEDKMKIKTVS